MNKQHLAVQQFREIYDYPTLKRTSELTGLNMSRIHRIWNGAEMKFSEYTTFTNLIEKKSGMQESRLEGLMKQCLEQIPISHLQFIEQVMQEKLKITSLRLN